MLSEDKIVAFLNLQSIEVCKEAFEPFSDKIPLSDIPDILKN